MMKFRNLILTTIFLNGLAFGLAMLWIGYEEDFSTETSDHQEATNNTALEIYQKDFPLFALYGKSCFSMQGFNFMDAGKIIEADEVLTPKSRAYHHEFSTNKYTWSSVYTFYSISE